MDDFDHLIATATIPFSRGWFEHAARRPAWPGATNGARWSRVDRLGEDEAEREETDGTKADAELRNDLLLGAIPSTVLRRRRRELRPHGVTFG
jgi:hypothetical protein